VLLVTITPADMPPPPSTAPAGTLPPAWGVLTKLKLCYLWDNTLSGPLPSAWSGMAALQELALYNNNLTGEPLRQAGRDFA
jgi:hypothetical protein